MTYSFNQLFYPLNQSVVNLLPQAFSLGALAAIDGVTSHNTSATQKDVLSALYDDVNTPGGGPLGVTPTDLYLYVLAETSQVNVSTNTLEPKMGVDPSAWLWVEGAVGVNSNDGSFFSDFIRDYTAQQYYLRYGNTLPNNAVQLASDNIAKAFAVDILNETGDPNLNPTHELPPVQRIGEIDAGAIAAGIFNVAPFDASPNYSPWAGTILFPFLGEGSFAENWLLTAGTNDFKKISGTYDLISVAQAAWDSASLIEALFNELNPWNSRTLSDTVANNSLGTTATLALLSSLRDEANTFFQTYYTVDNLEQFQIGGDLPLYSGVLWANALEYTDRPNYIVGKLANDAAIGTYALTSLSLGQDIVNAGLGNDTIYGSTGFDLIDGAEGTDTLDYGSLSNSATVILKNLVPATGMPHDHRFEVTGIAYVGGNPQAWTDFVYNVETLRGTTHQDTFIIEKMKDGLTIDGGGNTDILDTGTQTGSLTFDLIQGKLILNPTVNFSNFETFKGGSGGDTFKVNNIQSAYKLHGNAGSDTADYTAAGAFLKVLSVPGGGNNYTVDKYFGQTSATGSYERDELFSIEDIIGNTANGISIDNAGGKLVEGQGLDPIYNYVIPVTYAPGDQALKHTLRGTGFGETLTGGSAADIVDGRSGADTAIGGRGNDLYLYCFTTDDDIINDGGYATDLDTLWFNCDLDFEDLIFERHNASDIKITFAGAVGSMLLQNAMSIPIDYIKMRDGSVTDMETVLVTVKGTGGNDTLLGTNDNGAYREGALIHDVMYGYGGIDTMSGYSGTDQIYGGAGNDTLNGGDGGDHLYGEGDNDTINGEAGDDFLYAGDGTQNTLNGGHGHDTYEGGSGNDTMTDASNSGNEIYKYSGGTDTIYDWGGSDTLRMNGSATIENTTITVSGYDLIVGGNLTVTYFNYGNAYKIETIEFSDGSKANLTTHASWTKGTASNDTLNGTTSANTLVGYDGDDTVNALAGADQVFGGAGADTLYGGSGADTIYGGDGNDIIEGGDDGDIIYGGAGSDNIKGNAGVDTFVFRSMGDAGDTIQDFNTGAGEKIDISDLLTGYDPLSSFITDFVQITDNGTNSFLSIDSDGGANNFVSLATIYGTGLTDEAALLSAGNLIAV